MSDTSCFVTFPASTPEDIIKLADSQLEDIIVCSDVGYVNDGQNVLIVDRKTVQDTNVIINCSRSFDYDDVVRVVTELGYKPMLLIYDC